MNKSGRIKPLRLMPKGKKGGFTDLFLFMIFAIVIIFVCVLFVYLGGKVLGEVHDKMDNMTFGDANTSQTIDETLGKVNQAYGSLYWISIFLIVGMIISIFIGSYLVTTKPVFFIPYFFITVIAVIVSIGLSNAYEQVMLDPTLASTFQRFVGANFIMLNLPIWMSVIGILGGIIMFSRMGSREAVIYGGYG